MYGYAHIFCRLSNFWIFFFHYYSNIRHLYFWLVRRLLVLEDVLLLKMHHLLGDFVLAFKPFSSCDARGLSSILLWLWAQDCRVIAFADSRTAFALLLDHFRYCIPHAILLTLPVLGLILSGLFRLFRLLFFRALSSCMASPLSLLAIWSWIIEVIQGFECMNLNLSCSLLNWYNLLGWIGLLTRFPFLKAEILICVWHMGDAVLFWDCQLRSTSCFSVVTAWHYAWV